MCKWLSFDKAVCGKTITREKRENFTPNVCSNTGICPTVAEFCPLKSKTKNSHYFSANQNDNLMALVSSI